MNPVVDPEGPKFCVLETNPAPEGMRGSYVDAGTGQAYWVTPVKKAGSHAHFAPRVRVRIDPDARYEYRRVRTDPT